MRKISLLLLFTLLSLSNIYSQQIEYIGGSISTPNSNFPVNNTTTQSYSEAFYKTTEVTNIDTIYGIEYSISSGSLSGGNTWDIYLKEKNKSNYRWGISSFEQDSLTQVFSGNVSIVSNKITIYFDTPFYYTNVSDLVVIVHKKNTGTGSVVYNQTGETEVRCASYSSTSITPTNLPSNVVTGDNENPSNMFPRVYWRPQMGFITTPKCLPPSNLVVTNTTASGARVDFAGGDGVTWNLTVGGTTKVLTDSLDVITGLSNNSVYSIAINTDCGTGGVSSNVTKSFRTNICDEGPMTNFTEDFSTPDFFSNSCWSQIGRPAGGSVYYSARQVDQEIQFHPSSTGILVLPEIQDISAGKLTFTYSGNINLLQVGTVNIPYEDANAVYSNIESIINLPGAWIESVLTPIVYTVDLSSYTGTDKYLVIRGKGASSINSNLFIDDVSFSSPDTTVSKQLCKGDFYDFAGVSLTEEGIYYDTIQVNSGDSIVKLELEILEPSSDTVSIVSCDTYNSFYGMIYSTSGLYSDTLMNVMGCDSIIVTDLTIVQTPDVSNINEDDIDKCLDDVVNITLPDAQLGETYTVNNFTTGITINDPLEIVSLPTTLSLPNLPTETIEIVAESSDNGTICTAPSKIINVNSITIDSVISTTGNTLQVTNDQNASYTWTNCDADTLISGEINNSYSPTVSGEYKVEITNGVCVKNSDCMILLINGLHKLTEGSVVILPNPVSSRLILNSIFEIQKIEIYSVNGLLVQTDNKVKNMDVSLLDTGIYSVIVYTEYGVSVQKLIKE